MVPAAPRLHPRLVNEIIRLSKSRLTAAEITRRVGAKAADDGLPRPSYERVRVLVHEARDRALEPSTADVLLDVAFRVRPPDAIGAHLAGTLPPGRSTRRRRTSK
jgi:hypothetical protein